MSDIPDSLRLAVSPLLAAELQRMNGEEADANLIDCQSGQERKSSRWSDCGLLLACLSSALLFSTLLFSALFCSAFFLLRPSSVGELRSPAVRPGCGSGGILRRAAGRGVGLLPRS